MSTGMQEVYEVVIRERGQAEIASLTAEVAAHKAAIAQLGIDYRSAAIGADEFYDNAGHHAAQIDQATERLEKVSTASRKLKIDTGAAGRGILDLGRATQDFAQGGIAGILNNIEGLATNFGKLAGISAGTVSAIAGIATAVGVLGFVIMKNWDSIAGFFSTRFEIPSTAADSVTAMGERLKEVKDKLTEIRKQQTLNYTGYEEYLKLTQEELRLNTELEKSKERQKVIDKLRDTKTETEQRRADVFSAAQKKAKIAVEDEEGNTTAQGNALADEIAAKFGKVVKETIVTGKKDAVFDEFGNIMSPESVTTKQVERMKFISPINGKEYDNAYALLADILADATEGGSEASLDFLKTSSDRFGDAVRHAASEESDAFWDATDKLFADALDDVAKGKKKAQDKRDAIALRDQGHIDKEEKREEDIDKKEVAAMHHAQQVALADADRRIADFNKESPEEKAQNDRRKAEADAINARRDQQSQAAQGRFGGMMDQEMMMRSQRAGRFALDPAHAADMTRRLSREVSAAGIASPREAGAVAKQAVDAQMESFRDRAIAQIQGQQAQILTASGRFGNSAAAIKRRADAMQRQIDILMRESNRLALDPPAPRTNK